MDRWPEPLIQELPPRPEREARMAETRGCGSMPIGIADQTGIAGRVAVWELVIIDQPLLEAHECPLTEVTLPEAAEREPLGRIDRGFHVENQD
jgi:hypothetical protein